MSTNRPHSERYKYHIHQLMENNDYLKEAHLYLESDLTPDERKNFYIEAVQINPRLIEYVPSELETFEQICIQILKEDPTNIRYISPTFPNYKSLCVKACALDISAVGHISPRAENYKDICMIVVKLDKTALSYIPIDTKGYKDICLRAIKVFNVAIQFVPPTIDDYLDIAKLALEQDYKVLQLIPYHVENYDEICKHVIMENWLAINHVDKRSKSYEDLCDLACTSALQLIDLNKPLVVMLYAPEDGVTNADYLCEFFKKNNFTYVLVSPYNNEFLHPLLQEKYIKYLDGLILPGGPNIDSKPDRTAFEILLLEKAIQHNIPLMGICRGHQLIGHYLGGEVRTMTHQHEGNEICFLKDERSKMWKLLDNKVEKIKTSPKSDKYCDQKIQKSNEGSISVKSSCQHNQAVFFSNCSIDTFSFHHSQSKKDHIIKVIAKAKDGIIEAMEVDEHIISFQHHNEKQFITNRLAKTMLNLFRNMAYHHYENRSGNLILKGGKLIPKEFAENIIQRDAFTFKRK